MGRNEGKSVFWQIVSSNIWFRHNNWRNFFVRFNLMKDKARRGRVETSVRKEITAKASIKPRRNVRGKEDHGQNLNQTLQETSMRRKSRTNLLFNHQEASVKSFEKKLFYNFFGRRILF